MSTLINQLSAAVLDDAGRDRFDRVRVDLEYAGRDQYAERHPDLAESFERDEPSDPELLVAVGLTHRTVGWVEWSGEDDDHQVRDMVISAGTALGLTLPDLPSDLESTIVDQLDSSAERGDYVPRLLRSIDSHLSSTGLRLMIIDLDSDSYYFAPVTAEVLAALDGAESEHCRLSGPDRL